jgi:hypothetical protein
MKKTFTIIMLCVAAWVGLATLNSKTVADLDLPVATQHKKEESKRFAVGVWHGWILPISLIVSWFDPNVTIYDATNNGPLYNVGFLI